MNHDPSYHLLFPVLFFLILPQCMSTNSFKLRRCSGLEIVILFLSLSVFMGFVGNYLKLIYFWIVWFPLGQNEFLQWAGEDMAVTQSLFSTISHRCWGQGKGILFREEGFLLVK